MQENDLFLSSYYPIFEKETSKKCYLQHYTLKRGQKLYSVPQNTLLRKFWPKHAQGLHPPKVGLEAFATGFLGLINRWRVELMVNYPRKCRIKRIIT